MKERKREMCHHFSMISCYLPKGDRFKPLDSSGGFLVYEAKPYAFLFFLGRISEGREKEVKGFNFQNEETKFLSLSREKLKRKIES